MKGHEFARLESKLELKTRNTKDRHAWFEYDGRIIVRTKRSHGSGFDLPKNLIRQQLKLNERQLDGIIKCSLHKDDYVSILKEKGLIPSTVPEKDSASPSPGKTRTNST